ncbi:Ferredoxin OS=Streptomyces microflavus OX=1919 GN=HUT09_31610 PE=4 SV=1 [Streptomyces microflavus]
MPGAFYGADTDNCGTGRIFAPALVLHREVFSAYGCDGDDHWTPETVREWWRDRARVTAYLAARRPVWDADDEKSGQGTAAAGEACAAYLDGELAAHLRAYLFWLDERRSPTAADRLPQP